MNEQKIVIIDTGCANVSSVRFAIERLGFSVDISKDPQVVLAADKLFLPGVGTASEAMKNLQERDLINLVKQVEKPLLGICLGMQLLGKSSQEKGQKADQQVECLGLCDGEVKRMETGALPLPHMGWNTVKSLPEHPLFKGIEEGEYFYFVHSFAMPVASTRLRNVIMVSRSRRRCKVVITTVCSSTQSVRAKRAQNLLRTS